MKRDGMERIWEGGETHIAAGVSPGLNGVCHYCRIAPARVYLKRHLLCGVCWNKVEWLRWAKDALR